MTGKEFMNAVANGGEDVLQQFLDALAANNAGYCVIGGLAVNAYAEPVVSLDLDVVVAAENQENICAAVTQVFRINRFPHSVNLDSPHSDLRIQIQTDARYQEFLEKAEEREVLGYRMRVAALEDVLRGKLWAYEDEERRPSKRQKDLADIYRLVEVYPHLIAHLPEYLQDQMA